MRTRTTIVLGALAIAILTAHSPTAAQGQDPPGRTGRGSHAVAWAVRRAGALAQAWRDGGADPHIDGRAPAARHWIDVRTRARQVTVYRDGTRGRRVRAVVGKPATPTPHGLAAIYRIRVGNPSGVAADDLRVCDRLLFGLAYASDDRDARLSKGHRCWTIKRLGAGKSRTVRATVRALPGASGRKVNHVTATSPNIESGLAKHAIRVIAMDPREGGVAG